MTFKEFVRPNKWKLIISIIISIIIIAINIKTFSVYCSLVAGFDCSGQVKEAQIDLLLSLILWVAITYILVCIGSFLIKRIKKIN